MPHAFRLFSPLLAAAWLAGCQPKTDAPAAIAPAPPAASAAAGAADDRPATLMAEVFPGWAATPPYAASMPTGQGNEHEPVLVSPLKVVTLADDHRMLLVAGVPDDGSGQPLQANATSVNLGAYGFERRAGRWARTFDRPSLAWTGFRGEVGDVKVQAFGAGRTLLSIQNGQCGHGVCSEWLRLFALAPGDARALTPDLRLSRRLDDASGCADWLAGRPRDAADATDPVTPENCADVGGSWRFEPAAEPGWPELVLAFQGRQAVQAPASGQVRPRAVDAQWRLRHDGSGYRAVSGRNPLDPDAAPATP